MTDYTKATGNGGSMMIRDTGTNVELWVIAGSTSTWVNGATYGGTWSGTFDYPTGGNWLRIRSVSVTTNITVTFTLNATGTSGLGGPTTLSAAITRDTVPPAPDPVVISSVTSTSVYTVFAGNGDGGAAIIRWETGYGTSSAAPQIIVANYSGTRSGLTRSTTYYFWGRGVNSVGAGPWSVRSSATTLHVVPDAPSAVSIDSITNTSVNAKFTFTGSNGGASIDLYRIHYGTDPNNPVQATYVDTTTGNPNIIGGLAPGTTYYFWAYAHNAVGWSAAGGRGSATTHRIPDAPNAPVISEIKQTSVKAVFAGNGDGGSPILEWQIGYGLDPVTPQLSYSGYNTTLTGLSAGLVYYFWSRGRNTYGWGPYSARSTATLIAGAWVDVAGVKKRAVPYVRDAGVWKVAEGWAKIAGLWKVSG